MRLLFWIFVLLVALVLAVFAVSNRESVTLGLWPAPFLVEIPLYVAMLAALAVGFVLGEVAAWIARRRRREAASAPPTRLPRRRVARDPGPAARAAERAPTAWRRGSS